MSDEICIGIDFGASLSCVGIWKKEVERVEIIPNEEGDRTTASCVAYNETERIVGSPAINQIQKNEANTILHAKRLIGKKFSDEDVQKDIANFPFTVVAGDDDKPVIEVNYKGSKKQVTPEEVAAVVIKYMKEIAQDYLGKPVTSAVIAVPVTFNDAQRLAMRQVAKLAGLTCKRIINEPAAVAIAYGLDKKKENSSAKLFKCSSSRNVLVFDLGSKTLDCSLIQIDDGIIQVKASAGDSNIGGEDFDGRLVKHFAAEFQRKFKKDLTTNARSMSKLKKSCENTKKFLSTSQRAQVELDALFESCSLYTSITRARFEDMCSDLFSACLKPIDKVLQDANVSREEVDDVIVVGGCSNIPKIQQLISNYFSGKELCKSIKSEEAVATGAAIQAAILSSNNNDEEEESALDNMVLLDVAPLTLGIETFDGLMAPLITRNTIIPASRTQVFTTSEDNQTSVLIKVFEGERAKTVNNRLLATFDVSGIEPAPKATAKIEVTFKINADGILTVTAEDKNAADDTTAPSITITKDCGDSLTTQKVNEMIKEAKQFKVDDDKTRASYNS